MAEEKAKAARGRPARGSRPDGRTRLLHAALVDFAAHGYSGAHIEHILQEANVTAPTLYHHFGNKARLFTAAANSAYDRVEERFRRDVESAPTFREALDAIFMASIEMMDEEPLLSAMLLTIQIDIRRNPELQDDVRPVLTAFSELFDEVAAMAPPEMLGPNGDVRILSRTLVSLVNGLNSEALLLRRKEDFPAIVRCMRDLVLASPRPLDAPER